jgi:hypothetical protein
MPLLRYPTALVGATLPSKDTPVEMQLAIKPATADVGRRANKIGRPVSLTKGLSALQFYRFIAKIAHAFTAAELGMDAFTPCLLNLIRGEIPMFADHYVGSGIGNDPPVPHLHELSFVPQAPVGCSEQIVVRIRLFANLDMPTHYAVSGSRRVS